MLARATAYIILLCFVGVVFIYMSSKYRDKLGVQDFHTKRSRWQVKGVFEEASTFLQRRYDPKRGSKSSTVDAGYAEDHLGDKDVSKEIPRKGMRRKEHGGYYMGMDEEEGEGHNLEKYRRNKRDVISAPLSAKHGKTHWFNDITVLIKTFNRPKPTKDLIASVLKYFPTMKVLVADDGILNQKSKYRVFGRGIKYFKLRYDQGLSYGRNYLVRKASTKLVLVLDDDFQFGRNTSLSKLYLKIHALNADIVAGKLDDREAFGANIQVMQGTKTVIVKPASRPIGNNASQCWKTQRVLNFFLAKRTFLLNNPWEDSLKLEEHTFFFASAFMRNNFGKNVSIYSCDDVLVHHNIQPQKRSYDVFRKRAIMYGTKAKILYMKKYGYRLNYCVGDCGARYKRL
eukprot:g13789.t1